MRRIGWNNCPYCGNSAVYASQPKNLRDELCCFIFLQVVRCSTCMRRHYRPLFLPPVPIWSEKKPSQSVTVEGERRRAQE
jgi:hypothetical protein